MIRIKNSIVIIATILFSIFFSSCHKEEKKEQQKKYINRIAEDLQYRLGKWYCVTDMQKEYNMTRNSFLDTVWFISDSVAGWTGFSPDGSNNYEYRKTYFRDYFHLIFLAQNPIDTNKIDTATYQCGITPIGDTMTIYWRDLWGSYPEQYLKKKN